MTNNNMIPSSIAQYYNAASQLFDRFVDSTVEEEPDNYEPLPINYGRVDPVISSDTSQIVGNVASAVAAAAEATAARNEAAVAQHHQCPSSSSMVCTKRKRDSVCPSYFMEVLSRDSMLARGARSSFLDRESFVYRSNSLTAPTAPRKATESYSYRRSLTAPEDIISMRDSFLQKIDDTMFSDAKEMPAQDPHPPIVHLAKKQRKGTSGGTPKQKEAKWLAMLEELKSYKTEHGDCIVPRGWAPNPKLASWVAEQRKQYKLMTDKKTTNITPGRVALLEEIGFAWNAQEAAWTRHFADLERYRDEHGDCLVALSYDKSPQLGLWVKEQRRHYALLIQGRKSHITEERVSKLESIGFCWDSHTATWWERYRELEAYRAQFGDCLVPTTYESNKRLGTWVHHQRRQYRKLTRGQTSHMTEERAEALNSIGFCWFPRQQPDDQDDGSGYDEEAYRTAAMPRIECL